MRLKRRYAALLLDGAERLMPAEKADWARAMAAEAAHLPHDPTALAFAAGCARAAGVERMRALAPDAAWGWPGAAFGTLLLASALVQGSGSLPLLWSPIGGLVAVLLLGEAGRTKSFLAVIAIATKTGALIGLLFAVAALFLLLATGQPLVGDRATGFAAASVAVVLLTSLGGAAVAPLVCKPPRVKGGARSGEAR